VREKRRWQRQPSRDEKIAMSSKEAHLCSQKALKTGGRTEGRRESVVGEEKRPPC